MQTEQSSAAPAGMATTPSPDTISEAVKAGQTAEAQRQETQTPPDNQAGTPPENQDTETANISEASTDAGDYTAEGEAETSQTGDRKRNNVPARERIKQLTDKIHSQDAIIADLTGRLNQPPQTGPGEYDDGYDDESGYYDPETIVNQATERAKREFLEGQRQAAMRERQTARKEVWDERCASIRDAAPDFDQVTSDPTLPIPPYVAEALLSAENGPQVAYYLAKNRHEAAQIARMHPMDAAIQIGGLSQRLGVPPVRKTTQAPPPPVQVTGAGNAPGTDPSKLQMDDYAKWRRRPKG